MNLYIIAEGERTEMLLYPMWLQYCLPQLLRIENFELATSNSYYLFSGQGIPSIYNHIVNAIKDVNNVKNYDYLIVIVDAEEITPELRKQKVLDHIDNSGLKLNSKCTLEIIVQNKCAETWFLGNKNIYKRNPQGKRFKEYSNYYNVETNDPELMGKSFGFKRVAHFHESYLREMLKEYNIRYRKNNPGEVLKKYYFEELVKRVNENPAHLNSFSKFINLIDNISQKLKE